MFISDNGPHQEGGGDPVFFKSSGGLRGIKRDLYEGGIRVPMIARWPGTIPAGRVSSHSWAHWDMLADARRARRREAPAGLDGLSMARALRGQTQPTHDFFYWEFHERGFQQAVRMGDWKAVRLAKDAPLELYDLAADPAERRNVRRGQSRRRQEDRDLPGDRADRQPGMAGEVAASRQRCRQSLAGRAFFPIAYRCLSVRRKICPFDTATRAEGVFVHGILGDDLELRPGGEHRRHAVLAGDVDLAVGEHRRRAVGARSAAAAGRRRHRPVFRSRQYTTPRSLTT